MERWNIPELDADGAARTAGTVCGWNALALRAVGTRPHGAHALALLHGAMYNAWAAYDGAAEVLRRFTRSDRLGGGARWTTFTQAAQAGMTNARDDAQAFGRKVGARVFDKARRYWQGKL